MKTIRKIVVPAGLVGMTYFEVQVLCGVVLSIVAWSMYAVYKLLK